MESDDPLRCSRHIKSTFVPYITHRYQELFGGNWVGESDGFVQITFARVGNAKGSLGLRIDLNSRGDEVEEASGLLLTRIHLEYRIFSPYDITFFSWFRYSENIPGALLKYTLRFIEAKSTRQKKVALKFTYWKYFYHSYVYLKKPMIFQVLI